MHPEFCPRVVSGPAILLVDSFLWYRVPRLLLVVCRDDLDMFSVACYFNIYCFDVISYARTEFGVRSKFRGNNLRGKTLTNHAAYLNYIDNFRNKQRTKKIISDMKSKLNVDMFWRLKSLFHLYFIQINFENGDKNGPFLRGK